MNSLDRKELRYQRRKKRRENKLIINSDKYADVNKCFTFNTSDIGLYDYTVECNGNNEQCRD